MDRLSLIDLFSYLEDDSENLQPVEVYAEAIGLDINNLMAEDLSTKRSELRKEYPDNIVEINIIFQCLKDYIINGEKKEILLKPPTSKTLSANKTPKGDRSILIVTKGDDKVGYYKDWR